MNVELHAALAMPVVVHTAPPGDGHVMVPHAAAVLQVTSHAHALPQLIASHAPVALHVTLHNAFAPQAMPWHEPVAAQLKAQGTPEAHWRLLHAFIVWQLTVHDLAPAGQTRPPHALELVHRSVHAYPDGQLKPLHWLG